MLDLVFTLMGLALILGTVCLLLKGKKGMDQIRNQESERFEEMTRLVKASYPMYTVERGVYRDERALEENPLFANCVVKDTLRVKDANGEICYRELLVMHHTSNVHKPKYNAIQFAGAAFSWKEKKSAEGRICIYSDDFDEKHRASLQGGTCDILCPINLARQRSELAGACNIYDRVLNMLVKELAGESLFLIINGSNVEAYIGEKRQNIKGNDLQQRMLLLKRISNA